METGKVVINTRVDTDTADALRKLAADNSDTTSAHVRKVLTAHVKKQEVKPHSKKEYDAD